MSRKSNKSPSERRAELEAQLEAARIREARSLAKDNNAIQALQEVYDRVSKQIAAISRQMNGPESFENRRRKFELRLAEIDAGETLAINEDHNLRMQRDYLRKEIDRLADEIANGYDFPDTVVEDILNGVPLGVNLNPYVADFQNAQDARKEFIAALKQPVRSKSIEAE